MPLLEGWNIVLVGKNAHVQDLRMEQCISICRNFYKLTSIEVITLVSVDYRTIRSNFPTDVSVIGIVYKTGVSLHSIRQKFEFRAKFRLSK